MKWNKEKIKELILTDFIDGELSVDDKKEIEAVIELDAELKVFYAQVKSSTRQPFEKARELIPPAHVFHAIEDRLDAQTDPDEAGKLFWERLKDFFRQPQAAYAFSGAAACAVILALTLTLNRTAHQEITYDSEAQIEYLMLLASDSPDESEEGFQNPIEKFFL